MAQSSPTLTLPVVATEALTKFRMVNIAGQVVGAGETSLGVSQCNAAIGEVAPVDALGTTEVEVGAAVALGAALESDATGRAITQDSGEKVGRALKAASAAGQIIEMLLIAN